MERTNRQRYAVVTQTESEREWTILSTHASSDDALGELVRQLDIPHAPGIKFAMSLTKDVEVRP